MKTLKILFAALLMIGSFSSFSADGSKNEKLHMNYTLQTYINAVSHGKIKPLYEVLDRDVRLTAVRNNAVVNYSKDEILRFLKNSENIEQDCTTTYSTIELNKSQAIVKISMKYAEFDKITVLNISNTSRGWKITNISNSFVNP